MTFADVLAKMRKDPDRTFHLLLGNGFSIGYDASIFSYQSLSEVITSDPERPLARLFNLFETSNFELVMRQLRLFPSVAEIFGADPVLASRVADTEAELKTALLKAIETLHPEHVFKIPPDKSAACATFLANFGGYVFTTNYDLLLYWILMRNAIPGKGDGFGRDRLDDGGEFVPADERVYSEELLSGRNRRSQRVFYLHGALHLFDTGREVIKEVYEEGEYLLERVRNRLREDQYPLFVTGGDADDKLRHIRQNPYLLECLEALRSVKGSLVTFGFNFGQYDSHILEAVDRAARQPKPDRLWSIYVGVFSEEDEKHIRNVQKSLSCKVHLFDSKSVSIWS